MNAKKCDRCGKFYIPYYGFGDGGKDWVGNKVHKYIFNGLNLIQEIEVDKDIVNDIDLCQECAQDFANWLEMKGDE